MYKYGIAYYQAQGSSRVPVTGLSVRLVRPGLNWSDGLSLQETAPGYYEITVLTEAQCGFYEIWDTSLHPPGGFSGKHAVLGKLDFAGIQGSSNIFAIIADLQNQITAMNKLYGADIYVSDREPQTTNDYVWIDTTGVEFIRE